MKTELLDKLTVAIYEHRPLHREDVAVLMGESDYNTLRRQIDCKILPYTDDRAGVSEPVKVHEITVHSDLRAGNRGWIIGSKTEIEKMRRQLIEAQYSEAFVRWFNDLHRKEQSIMKPDPINPSHYKSSKIEPIDYMRDQMTEEEFRGFLKGNIIKYTSRAEKKGGKEDYKKAAWYADKLAKL